MHGVDTLRTPMGDGGWHLSSKTICALCPEKIRRGRDSYGTDPETGLPAHFRCLYPLAESEMAVSGGDDPQEGSSDERVA